MIKAFILDLIGLILAGAALVLLVLSIKYVPHLGYLLAGCLGVVFVLLVYFVWASGRN